MSNLNSRAQIFRDGVYILNIPGSNATVSVYCDMLNSGGNWTIFQRRIHGNLHFNRTWEEYAIGFGSVTSDFWLGNENLHLLTSGQENFILRIDTWDIFGDYRFIDYDSFQVGSRSDQFPLRIGDRIGGNLTDSMSYHSGIKFSAADLDRDGSSTHCAKYYGAGWWFSHCHKANLNGNFHIGMVWFDNSTAEWIHLQQTEMKLRPIVH